MTVWKDHHLPKFTSSPPTSAQATPTLTSTSASSNTNKSTKQKQADLSTPPLTPYPVDTHDDTPSSIDSQHHDSKITLSLDHHHHSHPHSQKKHEAASVNSAPSEDEEDFIAPIRKDSNANINNTSSSSSSSTPHPSHPQQSQSTKPSTNHNNANDQNAKGIRWNTIWKKEQQQQIQQQLQMQMSRMEMEANSSTTQSGASGTSTGVTTPTQELSDAPEIRQHPGTIPPPSSPYLNTTVGHSPSSRMSEQVHDQITAHRRASYTPGASNPGSLVAERALLQAEGMPFRGRRFSYNSTVYENVDAGPKDVATQFDEKSRQKESEYEPHSIRRHSIPNALIGNPHLSYHCPPLEEDPLQQFTQHMQKLDLDDARSLNPNAAVFGPQLYPAGFLDEVDGYFDGNDSRSRAWADPTRQNSFQSAMYNGPLYIVEFKGGRTDLFYVPEIAGITVKQGDLVIVEADRGKDLGKVVKDSITHSSQLLAFPEFLENAHLLNKDLHPKRIYHLAQPQEVSMLVAKAQDEAKSMAVCQAKVRQKKLPMEVVDGEYQWDRRKLTFYFVAERRIDFRELVRDLFKIYKTRIWMCAVDRNRLLAKQTRYVDQYQGMEAPSFM